MKIFLIVVIMAFFASSFLCAQGQSLSQESVTLNDANEPLWTVKILKGGEHPYLPTRIRVFGINNNLLMEYAAQDTSFFIAAKMIKLSKYPRPLLLTNWGGGVRTLCLRIFDPSLKKTAFLVEFCSIDLKYEVTEDHINISEFRYKTESDSTLVELRTEWSPVEPAKVDPSNTPQGAQNH